MIIRACFLKIKTTHLGRTWRLTSVIIASTGKKGKEGWRARSPSHPQLIRSRLAWLHRTLSQKHELTKKKINFY